MSTYLRKKRSSSAPTVLGGAKAQKFASVEGLVLSPISVQTLKTLRTSGLSGEALRNAIKLHFKTAREK